MFSCFYLAISLFLSHLVINDILTNVVESSTVTDALVDSCKDAFKTLNVDEDKAREVVTSIQQDPTTQKLISEYLDTAINDAMLGENTYDDSLLKEALKNAKNTKTPVKEVVKEPVKPQLIIYYTADSYSIKDKDMILLKALAKEMKKNPDSKYEICGYTDSKTGTPEYNSALREKRANNVINTLIRLGVDKDQLVKKTSDQTLNQFGAYALDRAVTITKI